MRLSTLAILLCSIGTANATTIWRTEDGGNGHAYWEPPTGTTPQTPWDNHDLAMTHSEATLMAATMTPPVGFGTGHLVTISSRAEDQFVNGHVNNPAPLMSAWIGLEAVGGEWRWVDGTPMTYTNIPWKRNVFGYPEFLYNPEGWPFDPPTSDHPMLRDIATSEPSWWPDIDDPGNPHNNYYPWSSDGYGPQGQRFGALIEWEPLPTLPGDLNADWLVNAFDINMVSSHWNEAGPLGDANADGLVNVFDVNLVSANWTSTQPVPEPATIVLVLIASVLLMRYVHGRHSH